MFDVSWSELLIVGVVALLVVGPKELPTLLRTVGKYIGLIKRQAAEFRAQFDEAMKEAELDQLRKEVETIKSDAENVLRDAEASVNKEVVDARQALDDAAAGNPPPSKPQSEPDLHDANGMPMAQPEPAVNGHAPTDSPHPVPRPESTSEPKAPV